MDMDNSSSRCCFPRFARKGCGPGPLGGWRTRDREVCFSSTSTYHEQTCHSCGPSRFSSVSFCIENNPLCRRHLSAALVA
jgi:hypothetical protein